MRVRFALVLVFLRGGFAEVDQEGFFAVLGAGSHLQHADGEAEQVIDGCHPAGIAAGEVIVDGDEVHTFAHRNAVQRLEFPRFGVIAPAVAGGFQPGRVERQRVEVNRQGGDQGFTLAGLHLGNFALMQRYAANELDIVVAQADGALAGFAHHRKGFGKDIV